MNLVSVWHIPANYIYKIYTVSSIEIIDLDFSLLTIVFIHRLKCYLSAPLTDTVASLLSQGSSFVITYLDVDRLKSENNRWQLLDIISSPDNFTYLSFHNRCHSFRKASNLRRYGMCIILRFLSRVNFPYWHYKLESLCNPLFTCA